MELKVWVDGIQRVVCGVSEQTTCQEVVIALARAIGEPRASAGGMLPGKRRPGVAECPALREVAGMTFIRASLPIKPRLAGVDAPRSREPKKSMTFNLGPMGSSEVFGTGRWRSQVPEGLGVGGSGAPQPSKDELFRRVLRQQEQLLSLEAHRDTLETDLVLWERGQLGSQEDEIFYLEHLVRRNETELSEEEFWQSELRLEKECERERQERVRSLRANLEEYTQRIYELSARTEALQEEIQWEMTKRGKETPAPSPTELEDMAAKMKRDLEDKVKQSTQLESNLASVEKALVEAERNLQAQTQELEELNKELRQCNLQQFIQQTGATVTVLQARWRRGALPEPGVFPSPIGFAPTSGAESPPRASTRQLLSHSRTLLEPLVSSLNPEVLSPRQSIWR
ncbi:RASF8 protein, partial [Oreotrochilus melanogaster]|nr:RASF8 protein [Oreotrochilus melanogaster]